jgi:dienelactone hydrolase
MSYYQASLMPTALEHDVILSRLPLLLLLPAAFLAGGTSAKGELALEILSEELSYESRGIPVHATFVRPVTDEDVPVVLMAHGHGGTRDEAGGFRRLAEDLARRGIASFRMDFAGSGESVEPFVSNSLSRMGADLRAGLEFVLSFPGIDDRRFAVVGYSMGARVAMLGLEDGYAAAVLWAPVGTDGPEAIFGLFGDRDSYLQLRNEARRNRYTSLVTPWGQQQQLSCLWFTEMDKSKPLEAIGTFPGPVLVIHGDADPIVPRAISESVAAAAVSSANVQLEIIPGADHGLGFYSGDPTIADRVIELTAGFLVTNLFQTERSPDAAF